MMRERSYPLSEFPHPSMILDAICRGERPRLDLARMSGDIAEMVSQCWDMHPLARPKSFTIVRRLPAIGPVEVPPNLIAVSSHVKERRSRAQQRNVKAHYDVFISYRVATDAETARRLKDALSAAGFSAFLDKDNIQGGQDWRSAFLEGLKKSAIFVPLLSDAGMESILRLTPEGQDDHCFLEVGLRSWKFLYKGHDCLVSLLALWGHDLSIVRFLNVLVRGSAAGDGRRGHASSSCSAWLND